MKIKLFFSIVMHSIVSAHVQEIDLRDVYNSLPTKNHEHVVDGINQLHPSLISKGISAILVNLPELPVAPSKDDFKFVETTSTQKSDNMITLLWRDAKDIKMSHKESSTQKIDTAAYQQAFQRYQTELAAYNKLLKLIDAIQSNISSLTLRNLNVIHKLNQALDIARKKLQEEYFFNNAVHTARIKLNEITDEQKSETSQEGIDKWQFRYRTIGLLSAFLGLAGCYHGSKTENCGNSSYDTRRIVIAIPCAALSAAGIIWSIYNSLYHHWYYQHRVEKAVQNYTMIKEFNEFEFDSAFENPIAVPMSSSAGI
ncbi:MAG TPA: hypothetical protein VHO47_04865 [Candidatus Babeliales bacterium]|nr:hypothetical protein [Candidatus Babeliales bacterium]